MVAFDDNLSYELINMNGEKKVIEILILTLKVNGEIYDCVTDDFYCIKDIKDIKDAEKYNINYKFYEEENKLLFMQNGHFYCEMTMRHKKDPGYVKKKIKIKIYNISHICPRTDKLMNFDIVHEYIWIDGLWICRRKKINNLSKSNVIICECCDEIPKQGENYFLNVDNLWYGCRSDENCKLQNSATIDLGGKWLTKNAESFSINTRKFIEHREYITMNRKGIFVDRYSHHPTKDVESIDIKLIDGKYIFKYGEVSICSVNMI